MIIENLLSSIRFWQWLNTHRHKATQRSDYSIVNSEPVSASKTPHSHSAMKSMESNWDATATSRTDVRSKCITFSTRKTTVSSQQQWDSKSTQPAARSGKFIDKKPLSISKLMFCFHNRFAILTPRGKADKEKTTSDVLRYPEECL